MKIMFWHGFKKEASLKDLEFRKLDDSGKVADFTQKWAEKNEGIRSTAETVPGVEDPFNEITNKLPKSWPLLKVKQRGV